MEELERCEFVVQGGMVSRKRMGFGLRKVKFKSLLTPPSSIYCKTMIAVSQHEYKNSLK